MHLLEAGNHKILLDCGLHQGRREEARRRNGHFPFHAHQIDAVIISHAHIDHCGNLPTLIRQGFDGPIYCTPPTRDLLRIMLADSAKIQEEDAAHINIARNYAEPWVQPLYTLHDVEKVFTRVVAVPYGRDIDVTKTTRFRFIEAGHVLGSAMVHLTAVLTPTEPSSAWAEARGQLTLNAATGEATVSLENMPDPPIGHTYVGWFSGLRTLRNYTFNTGSLPLPSDRRITVTLKAEPVRGPRIEYYYMLGLCYFYMAQCEKSYPLFEAALQIDPKDENALKGIRLCQEAEGTPTRTP